MQIIKVTMKLKFKRKTLTRVIIGILAIVLAYLVINGLSQQIEEKKGEEFKMKENNDIKDNTETKSDDTGTENKNEENTETKQDDTGTEKKDSETKQEDAESIDIAGKKVKLETSMGDIVIKLHEDMPITAGNFAKLVSEEFYDGIIFHRVINGFMVQGGDPTGTGTGDPGYKIKDEFTDHNSNNRGTISMANAGPNTGGSQFFLNLVDNNFLDSKHPVFGEIVEGMDILDSIGKVETGPGDRPIEEVKIVKATLI